MKRRRVRACIWCGKPHTRRALHCYDCLDKAVEWQINARRQVAAAIKACLLPPPTRFRCTDCNLRASEYEHRNYSRPLDVEPVCRSCNRRRGPAEDMLDPS